MSSIHLLDSLSNVYRLCASPKRALFFPRRALFFPRRALFFPNRSLFFPRRLYSSPEGPIHSYGLYLSLRGPYPLRALHALMGSILYPGALLSHHRGCHSSQTLSLSTSFTSYILYHRLHVLFITVFDSPCFLLSLLLRLSILATSSTFDVVCLSPHPIPVLCCFLPYSSSVLLLSILSSPSILPPSTLLV